MKESKSESHSVVSDCLRSHGLYNPWNSPSQNTRWRRKWQPTPVFLPGKSHGQRSLAGYSPWGSKELDMAMHTGLGWVSSRNGPVGGTQGQSLAGQTFSSGNSCIGCSDKAPRLLDPRVCGLYLCYCGYYIHEPLGLRSRAARAG